MDEEMKVFILEITAAGCTLQRKLNFTSAESLHLIYIDNGQKAAKQQNNTSHPSLIAIGASVTGVNVKKQMLSENLLLLLLLHLHRKYTNTKAKIFALMHYGGRSE
ncbi:hypothetical protein T11_1307 [Trichinella zimbabwensis]|uniref:Uncharacterized protein n=1 Tax=Trichinella zimbabwensis TaxID=268475 RepID=A0A0V1HRS7_9BILA|nr:hypothetical protein T11_1307 [Trichinella zimbabwensis]